MRHALAVVLVLFCALCASVWAQEPAPADPDGTLTINVTSPLFPDLNLSIPLVEANATEANVTLPETNVTLPEGNITLPERNITVPVVNVTEPERREEEPERKPILPGVLPPSVVQPEPPLGEKERRPILPGVLPPGHLQPRCENMRLTHRVELMPDTRDGDRYRIVVQVDGDGGNFTDEVFESEAMQQQAEPSEEEYLASMKKQSPHQLQQWLNKQRFGAAKASRRKASPMLGASPDAVNWVDVHYTRCDDGLQLNHRMERKGLALFEHKQRGFDEGIQLPANCSLQYSFTYFAGDHACDSDQFGFSPEDSDPRTYLPLSLPHFERERANSLDRCPGLDIQTFFLPSHAAFENSSDENGFSEWHAAMVGNASAPRVSGGFDNDTQAKPFTVVFAGRHFDLADRGASQTGPVAEIEAMQARYAASKPEFVDLHYQINNGTEMNVRMIHVPHEQSIVYRSEPIHVHQNDVVRAWFTYRLDNIDVSCDSHTAIFSPETADDLADRQALENHDWNNEETAAWSARSSLDQCLNRSQEAPSPTPRQQEPPFYRKSHDDDDGDSFVIRCHKLPFKSLRMVLERKQSSDSSYRFLIRGSPKDLVKAKLHFSVNGDHEM